MGKTFRDPNMDQYGLDSAWQKKHLFWNSKCYNELDDEIKEQKGATM